MQLFGRSSRPWDVRPAAPLSRSLSERLDDAPMLGTGAGHDAGVLATAGLTAMLFVRNPTGISHSPVEFAEREDCHTGVEALTRVTEELSR
jgi:N-carbamoyl-L-amino-acid hydrolase